MKHVEFDVDKNKLKGTLILPKVLKKNNPAIFFVHGWTSARTRSYQYATSLANLGYICFLFDMRGHGESGGDINKATTKEFLDDVFAAYDYFINVEGVDNENISLVASSFGCYLSSILSAKRKLKRMALRVPADYPNEFFNKSKMQTSGTDNPAVFAWRKRMKTSSETFALEAIAKFNGDVLLIESEKDTVVPHETVQNYANAIKDKQQLTHIVIKNAPHSIKEGPFKDKTENILVDWFKKFI